MKKRHTIARFLALTLAVVLVLGTACVPASAAAKTTTATSMKLAKLENNVTVTNANGQVVKVKAGASLYNGYTIKTGAASYAWLSLDNKTVIKMDAASKVSVQKSGKKIKVQLVSGNLFFNVSEALSKDEKLELTTSNMTTGVRGTSGQLTYDPFLVPDVTPIFGRTELMLTDGSTVCTPLGGTSATIIAGQALTINNPGVNVAGPVEPPIPQYASFSVAELIRSIGYIGQQVAADPTLQNKLILDSNNDYDPVSNEVVLNTNEEILKAQKEESLTQEAALNDANKDVPNRTSEAPAQVFTPISGGSGGGSTPPVTSYQVTFYYQPDSTDEQEIFATETVTSGNVLNGPVLQPTALGYWCLTPEPSEPPASFDFGSTISSNFALYWIPPTEY